MTIREKLEAYFKERLKGKWPFISTVELFREFGYLPKDELNAMAKEGLLTKREGVNVPLIEILPKGQNYLNI